MAEAEQRIFISEADQYLFGQGTHYDIYKKLKPRMVNPIVCFEGDFKKLSDISTSANTLIQTGMEKLQKGIYLRIESK